MNQIIARRILGVGPHATAQEITTQFRILVQKAHPDKQGGNADRFVEIHLAYTFLKEQSGAPSSETFLELATSFNLQGKIQTDINLLYSKYASFSESLHSEAKNYITRYINSARSSDHLKEVLEKQITQYLLDFTAQIEIYVKHQVQNAPRQSELLFALLESSYRKRREMWIHRLYRNPMVVTAMIINTAHFIVKIFPESAFGIEALQSLSRLPWVPFASIGLVGLYLGIQYFRLSPRRQFLPPNLSVKGIDELVQQQMTQVSATCNELTTGGALAGGIMGALIIPEPLTILVMAFLGSLFGIGGRSLQEMKDATINALLLEMNIALSQLNRVMTDWCKTTSVDLFQAASDSYGENLKKLMLELDDKTTEKLIALKQE